MELNPLNFKLNFLHNSKSIVHSIEVDNAKPSRIQNEFESIRGIFATFEREVALSFEP